MKKLFVFVLAVFMVSAVFASGRGQDSSVADSTSVRMATGSTTGTYYPYGTAIGQVLYEKTGVSFTIQSTGASAANIYLIDEGEVEIAMVQTDVMDYAWRGVDLFNGTKINSFSSMAGLYQEACQIVASASSGIRTIADLKGKTVSVGDAGSGTEFNARQILEAYGVSFNDITRQNLGFGPSADALKDNKIDAFFGVAGAPSAFVTDLVTSKDVVFLEVDDAHAAQLIRSYPFYSQLIIPANTYRGQTSQVKTVAVKAALIVSSKLSENTVYKLTKAMFENKALISHAKASDLSPAYAVDGVSVPFHPGAAKYFREVGVLK